VVDVELVVVTVCQVWIGDGRDDYHKLATASIADMTPKPDHLVVIDDRDHQLGFSGAVQQAWTQVLETGADYVFHCELDFTYNEPVPIDRMIGVLERHPEVVQLSLKRQPMTAAESAAGDILLANAEHCQEIIDGEDVWVNQRRWFTTNPSLYRTDLCRRGWPQCQYSEGTFTIGYLQDHPHHWFGVWGALADPARVTHIGHERVGTGY
jgi:hypothetical protein